MNSLVCGCRRHRFGILALVSLALLDVATTSLALGWFPTGMQEQSLSGFAAWTLIGPLGLLALKLVWGALWLPVFFLAGRAQDNRLFQRLISVFLGGVGLYCAAIVGQNLLVLAALA
jgi:hypothetical protein